MTFQDVPEGTEFDIQSGYLVEYVGRCTCSGGHEAVGYAHEQHCGWEPVMPVSELEKLRVAGHCGPSQDRTRRRQSDMSKPLTVEGFIDAFRSRTGWDCEPGTRITNELTEFATDRLGSRRDVDELHIIFCLAHGIAPYKPKDEGAGQTARANGDQP